MLKEMLDKPITAPVAAIVIGIGGVGLSLYEMTHAPEQIEGTVRPPQIELFQANSTLQTVELFNRCNELNSLKDKPTKTEVPSRAGKYESPVCEGLRVGPNEAAHAKSVLDQARVFAEKSQNRAANWASTGLLFGTLFAAGAAFSIRR